MALNPAALQAHRFADISQSYTARDAILYALGIGLGADPLAAADLRYLLADDTQALPTMAVTLGTPGLWVRDPAFGIDVGKLVHAAQDATFHAKLPASGEIVASARIASLADRGAGKGAALVVEREIRAAQSGTLYCTLRQTLLLRGDGGFGGAPPARQAPPALPGRPADVTLSCQTSPRAALIYQLSGDWNPLHTRPEAAAQAGFERPILHGLCSYGMAGWVLMQATGGNLAALSLRFAGIVYPGDRLDFSIWQDGPQAWFEAKIGGRTVLDQGLATITPQGTNR